MYSRFSFFAVGLIVSGDGTYRAGKGAYMPVTPGTLIGVYPGSVFEYGPKTCWEEYYIGFTGTGAAELLKAGLIPRAGKIRRVDHLTSAVAAFEEIQRVWNRAQAGDADRACLLGQRLLLDLFTDSMASTAATLDDVDAVLQECRRNLHLPLNFADMASRRGISYSLIRRRIRERTGFAPAKYLTRLRCETACMLLATTRLTIKEIARKVGIADPLTLSRTFHRTVGTSPSDYRARQRGYGSPQEIEVTNRKGRY